MGGQMVGDHPSEGAVAGRGDDVEGHVGQLEPGVARPAVSAHPLRRQTEQAAIGVHGLIQVEDRQGHMVEAGDQGLAHQM